MCKINTVKCINSDKVYITLHSHEDELSYLKGHTNDIHIFSENNLQNETRLVQRGRKDSTKYLLLPKDFREDAIPSNEIKCGKIEMDDKKILIFEVKKSRN